jgi:glycosyltransferase involved in cell wall biosynthesis
MTDLSIIVPNYRAEKELLIRCIKSILDRGGDRIEIVLVDDGNTDGYRNEVYSDAVFEDTRIKLIKQDNQGVSAARNNGVAEARGEYIAFVDADDVVMGDFVNESLSIAEKYDADMVIGGLIELRFKNAMPRETDDLGTVVFEKEHVNRVKAMLVGRCYYIKDSKGYVGRGPVAKLVRRSIAQSVRFDTELSIYEDTVWNMDVVEKCGRICRVDRVWYGYNYTEQSASKGFHPDETERSTKGMAALYQRMDMSDRAVRIAFTQQCMTEYKRIVRTYFLNPANKDSFSAKMKESKKMISTAPWDVPYRKDVYAGQSTKTKLKTTMYKLNMLLPIYLIK